MAAVAKSEIDGRTDLSNKEKVRGGVLTTGIFGEGLIKSANELFLGMIVRATPYYFQENGLVEEDVKPNERHQLSLCIKGSKEFGDKSCINLQASLGTWEKPFDFTLSPSGFPGARSTSFDMSAEEFFPALIEQLDLLEKHGSGYKS